MAAEPSEIIGPGRLDREDMYIEMYDGTPWYPYRETNIISIETLAHSLASLTRFTGHAKWINGRVYSVAEHSVKVSLLVPTLTGLLHDAHEALVNDLAKPVKEFIGGSYKTLEKKAEEEIARQYGLTYPHPRAIKDADITMCLIEAFDLLPSKAKTWGYYDEWRPGAMELYIERPELRPEGWLPQEAADKFINRAKELSRAKT